VPFPDEPFSLRVEVVPYRRAWAVEGSLLVARLRAFLTGVISVDHIGSTAVAGLAAKDCIDVMIQVHDLDTAGVADALERHGYRRRPEPWNQQETSYGIVCRKQVFAPPAGARSCNIHVRVHGGRNVRYALLFRDYLTADDQAANAWSRFKFRLAESVTDIAAYGQIKAPAQEILMQSAERWAVDHGWWPRGN
jgi:dephospho-CoA kinase